MQKIVNEKREKKHRKKRRKITEKTQKKTWKKSVKKLVKNPKKTKTESQKKSFKKTFKSMLNNDTEVVASSHVFDIPKIRLCGKVKILFLKINWNNLRTIWYNMHDKSRSKAT